MPNTDILQKNRETPVEASRKPSVYAHYKNGFTDIYSSITWKKAVPVGIFPEMEPLLPYGFSHGCLLKSGKHPLSFLKKSETALNNVQNKGHLM